jgi:O-antigen/teichoic acid export membrane protein
MSRLGDVWPLAVENVAEREDRSESFPTPALHRSNRSWIPDSLQWLRIRQIGFSIADQGLSVGGMFLANVMLARTQSKEEYGLFALSYSVFTLLAGLHNAAVLETFTIYGSGRYHQRFAEYARLLWRSNLYLGLGLTAALTLLWAVLARVHPRMASRTFLGMTLTAGILLSAAFLRRSFYMRRRPDLAARFSLAFFVVCVALLGVSARLEILSGFSAFLIVAAAWSVAGLLVWREMPGRAAGANFVDLEPRYWSEHWNYARWVLVTALVFQFTTQGYYWLAAWFLSVQEVADLRAMYNLATPVDQLFVAATLLVLPMMSLRYASRRMAGLLPVWRVYVLGVCLVAGGFAALVGLFGRPAMHLLYAGRFDDIAPLVRTLAPLPVVMGIGNSMNAALKAIEKPQAVFLAYVASGAATFLVGIPLIVRWGLRGAVCGMLSSGVVYSATLGISFYSAVRAEGCELSPAVAAGEDSVS